MSVSVTVHQCLQIVSCLFNVVQLNPLLLAILGCYVVVHYGMQVELLDDDLLGRLHWAVVANALQIHVKIIYRTCLQIPFYFML